MSAQDERKITTDRRGRRHVGTPRNNTSDAGRSGWTDDGRARRGLNLILANLPAATRVVAGWPELTAEQRDGIRTHFLPELARLADGRADA